MTSRTRNAWRAFALAMIAAATAACAHRVAQVHERAATLSDARQLVIVTIADWNADRGTMHRFERDGHGWRARGRPAPVVIGRAGAAWGVGLHAAQTGPLKQEGDGRSPAGVFALGTAFGYGARSTTRLPYAAMDADDYCVDVSGSPLYNRIVDARDVGAAAIASSTEPMRRDIQADGDERYRLGIVVDHNALGAPMAGSCIFLHLWSSPDTPTSGCTAMDESSMRALLRWLHPRAKPVFVLLPLDEYARLQATWNLPALDTP